MVVHDAERVDRNIRLFAFLGKHPQISLLVVAALEDPLLVVTTPDRVSYIVGLKLTASWNPHAFAGCKPRAQP
jgi:hypothetical protein